ncbi:uncharacterized protein FA14DRAFT_175566 [Meira miltonrushii]|uniref:Uncharacterized protein n=1 Tax=Meira miltonrushii TaxID=1280837 RepID=A0A316V7C2_9BASI|nr:uncharacterized protein FA14DRAFT_175566 [Meira miltonrushii]PWN31375.1 hypothetical protein FA14DRAFT_175566 [Meira miltonrushii]
MNLSNDYLQQISTSISPKTQLKSLSREEEINSHDPQDNALSQQDLEKLTEFLRSEPQFWSTQYQPLLSPAEQFSSATFPFLENTQSTNEDSQALHQGQHSDDSCEDTSDRQMKNYAILSQLWYPCSAEATIGEQLDIIQFPVSYRELVYRWIALGRPQLQLLKTPLDTKAACGQIVIDLQQMCEAQENSIIESIRTYLDNGYNARAMTFAHFASYLDVFSAVQAELACLENGLPKNTQNISRLYEETWWNCLQAFDVDRWICTARSSHNCLRHFLWGEVYDWPLQIIIDSFQIFKGGRSCIRSMLASPEVRERSALHTNLSVLGLVDGEAYSGFETSPEFKTSPGFKTSPSLDGFTSYWQSDRAAFESPSSTDTSSSMPVTPILNVSNQRRESSIGTSFRSESILEKVKEYQDLCGRCRRGGVYI